MTRLCVRVVVAKLVLASSLVPLNAEEHRTVTMDVLTVREVEVCPRGYGHPDGCGDVEVLNNLAGLKRANHFKEYKLDLRLRDGRVQQHAVPMKLKLSPGMMRAVSTRLGREPVLEERFAGLFVFHVDGSFRSILFRRHGSEGSNGGDVEGHRRWFHHHRGMFLSPIRAERWTVQLDEATVDFEFVPDNDER